MDIGLPAPAHRIGPNAITQMAKALRARLGEEPAIRVFAAAGLLPWLDDPPRDMVDERAVAALHHALFDILPDHASTIADEAGRRTADYILAHRIPRLAQWVLRACPPRLAARLLLRAIARHAWTFAGSGHFHAQPGPPVLVEIAANPIAAGHAEWHQAVFRRLFRALVSPAAEVRTLSCCATGAAACRFRIDLPPIPGIPSHA